MMVQRVLLAAVAGCLIVGTAVAADLIKLPLKDFKLKIEPEENGGYDEGEEKIFLYSNGSASCTVKVPEDGEYTLTLEASCTEAENELAKIKITMGETVVKESFALTTTDPKEYTFPVNLKKGETKLTVAFLNDKYKENEYDLNLFLHAAKLEKK